MNEKLFNIKIVSDSKHPIFEQRESGITHTPFIQEINFYSHIQNGNIEKIRFEISRFLENGLFIGRLSKDNLRQMQYWAVSCITLGIRHAIQGGLDEMLAYNLSDSYIMEIDKKSNVDDIVTYLEKIVIDLTIMVKTNSKINRTEIQNCLNYIDKNLHNKISLTDLAKISGYSPSYLSKLFKQEMGINVAEYIMIKKLEEAKELLLIDDRLEAIAYYLGFCSQSHFINCFKKHFNITPKQYRQSYKIHLHNSLYT